MKMPQPMHSAAVFVSATVGRASRRTSTSGAAWRASTASHAGKRHAATASASAAAEVQPKLAALRHEDQHSRERGGQERGAEPVDPAASAPAASADQSAGGQRGERAGRPIQKIADGPAWSTMTPASAGPSAAPTPRLTESVPIAACAWPPGTCRG